jgi:hypothetical protein
VEFFNHIKDAVAPDPEEAISVWGGDYNCVQVVERDTLNMADYANHGGAELTQVVTDRLLVDAWMVCRAADLPPHAQGFTRWQTNRAAASRIDRIYCSARDYAYFIATRVVPQPSLSDHDAVVTTFNPPDQATRSPTWKLNTAWLNDPQFVQLLEAAWRKHLRHYPEETDVGVVWCDYKEVVKKMARSWAIARAADKRRTVREIQTQLSTPNIPPLSRAQLRNQLTAINEVDYNNTGTAASLSYQFAGDRSTGEFFAKVQQSCSSNTPISSLTKADGNTTEAHPAITAELCKFWGKVFGEGQNEVITQEKRTARDTSLARIRRRLLQPQVDQLAAPISVDELQAAMKRAQRGKTPGPDGLPVEFYLTCWHFVGPVVHLLALLTQEGYSLPMGVTQANIALLHKTDEASPSAGQFRPISLLNADYKLISAVLASRLASVLSMLVDELQTGFVPGRLIWENITFNRVPQRHQHPSHDGFLGL